MVSEQSLGCHLILFIVLTKEYTFFVVPCKAFPSNQIFRYMLGQKIDRQSLKQPQWLELQYQNSKDPTCCTCLHLIKYLFHTIILFLTTPGTPHNNNFCLKNICLVIFYQGFEGQNMKLSHKDDFVFVGNCISRLVSH